MFDEEIESRFLAVTKTHIYSQPFQIHAIKSHYPQDIT